MTMAVKGPEWLTGPRRNHSGLDTAAWIMGPLILAFLSVPIPLLAENDFFFAAHGVSALTFALGLLAGIVVLTAVLWAVLTLVARRASPDTFDRIASSLVGVSAAISALVIAANVLTGSLSAPVAWLIAVVLALVGAVLLVVLSRRARAGRAVLVIVTGVTLWPLVTLPDLGGSPQEDVTIAFDDATEYPPVLLVVADELSYSVVSEPDGRIREAFPNLAEFQANATTYTEAYATANATHFAIPTMLAGVADATTMGEFPPEISGSGGPLSWLQSRYRVATDSIYFQSNEEGVPFVDLESGSLLQQREEGGPGSLAMLLVDTAAVIGRTSLPEPLSARFPELDDRWYDFWNLIPQRSEVGVGGDFIEVLSDPQTPGFVFLHSMVAHTPYVRDYDGQFWSPSSLGLREGGLGTDGLVELQRQVYAAAAMDLDRQVGWYLNELRRTGTYDDALIIVTADHGRTFPLESTWRVGDDRDQRWSDVVHVPLLVKQPGQTDAAEVSAPRSTAQISRTILDTAGAQVSIQDRLAPALTQEPTSPITFWFDERTGQASVETYEPFTVVEGWREDHFRARHPDSPFAVGIEPEMIGTPVPDGYLQVGTVAADPDPASSTVRAIEFPRPADQCAPDDGFGLVAEQGTIVGTLAWGPNEAGTVVGWGLVPEIQSDQYEIWCRPTA